MSGVKQRQSLTPEDLRSDPLRVDPTTVEAPAGYEFVNGERGALVVRKGGREKRLLYCPICLFDLWDKDKPDHIRTHTPEDFGLSEKR